MCRKSTIINASHMKVIVAIDSFKGCLTSDEANEAASQGLRNGLPQAQVVTVAMSDGGEGWLDACRQESDQIIAINVADPLLRPTKARYIKRGNTAVIEIAEACGLNLLKPEERNPLVASSFGVGQIITDALKRGCISFIVGLGGSGTSDAGRGMMEALKGTVIPLDVHFTIATDVDNPLYGPNGAANIFGPQKGATPEMIEILDRHARSFAEEAARKMDANKAMAPGAGAAGGLGYAFMQFMNAERRSGIDLILDMVNFDQKLEDADLIITGEGRADSQTLMGKTPKGILERAGKHNIPVILIAGQVDNRDALIDAGFTDVICINKKGLPLEEAIKHDVAYNNLWKAVEGISKTWHH